MKSCLKKSMPCLSWNVQYPPLKNPIHLVAGWVTPETNNKEIPLTRLYSHQRITWKNWTLIRLYWVSFPYCNMMNNFFDIIIFNFMLILFLSYFVKKCYKQYANIMPYKTESYHIWFLKIHFKLNINYQASKISK